MRWQEIINEGREGPLYHLMEIEKALAVFAQDAMEARWVHKLAGKEVIGNSFTRNKKLVWGRPVRLTVDQRILAQTNKIIPLDGEYVFRQTHGYSLIRDRIYNAPDSTNAVWSEEFVVGPISALHRIIIAITLWVPWMKQPTPSEAVQVYEAAKQYSEKWSIPLHISDEFIDLINKATLGLNEDDD